MLGIARDVLLEFSGHPRVAAFWLPRFARFAEWFAETESGRRNGLHQLFCEIDGSLEFGAPGGPFLLVARADRIDETPHGLIITDYKSGHIPSDKKVIGGLAPQLPLEAAIASAGGFGQIDDRRLNALRYISASGAEPPGKEQIIKTKDVSQLADDALDGLKRLIVKFDRADTPFSPARRVGFRYEYDDYAHLARVDEWSGGDDLDYEG